MAAGIGRAATIVLAGITDLGAITGAFIARTGIIVLAVTSATTTAHCGLVMAMGGDALTTAGVRVARLRQAPRSAS